MSGDRTGSRTVRRRLTGAEAEGWRSTKGEATPEHFANPRLAETSLSDLQELLYATGVFRDEVSMLSTPLAFER